MSDNEHAALSVIRVQVHTSFGMFMSLLWFLLFVFINTSIYGVDWTKLRFYFLINGTNVFYVTYRILLYFLKHYHSCSKIFLWKLFPWRYVALITVKDLVSRMRKCKYCFIKILGEYVCADNHLHVQWKLIHKKHNITLDIETYSLIA